MNRPEPIPDVYRLCDLPAGTRYTDGNAGPYTIPAAGFTDDDSWVQVVEWPQRTYDGLPADAVDVLMGAETTTPELSNAIEAIREAIARQADT